MTYKHILAGTLAVAIALVLAIPALADGPGAVAWLKTQQNDDDGFGTPESSVGATAEVILAVAATGDNALDWIKGGQGTSDGKTPLDYLGANVWSVEKAGIFSKVILALIASGKNPRTSVGIDLVAKLEGMIGSDGKIGGESDFINEHCFSMIALKSARRPIPVTSVNYLLSRQIADGTWSWNGDTTVGSGDNNTAAMAVVALIAAGVPADNAQIQKTLTHFKGQQNDDGGFPYVSPSPYGTSSDSNSTAVVMWAIRAAGQDPAGVDWKYMAMDGKSALDRLRAFQNESGAFRWQDAFADDNFMSTVQAVVALEAKTLPFATMDVGEAALEEPTTLPETGVNLWIPTIALLGSGAALMGVGVTWRRANGK